MGKFHSVFIVKLYLVYDALTQRLCLGFGHLHDFRDINTFVSKSPRQKDKITQS